MVFPIHMSFKCMHVIKMRGLWYSGLHLLKDIVEASSNQAIKGVAVYTQISRCMFVN